MNIRFRTIAIPIAVSAVAACSSLPSRIDSLEEARATVRSVEQDPLASEAAGAELAEAREAIMTTESAYSEGQDLAVIEHQAYVALRHAEIAEQRLAEAHARQQLEDSRAERDRVLLRDRENAADRALAVAAAREAKAEALQRELAALKAEQTERGPVLTLGDVLFDTDRAELKPGADQTVDRLAEFLASHSSRRVLIEGHADARGTESYNFDLSARRANAVRQALIDENVSPDRILVTGLGEEYPVASNSTQAGRQQNRRVEIVISDGAGEFPDAARRS